MLGRTADSSSWDEKYGIKKSSIFNTERKMDLLLESNWWIMLEDNVQLKLASFVFKKTDIK